MFFEVCRMMTKDISTMHTHGWQDLRQRTMLYTRGAGEQVTTNSLT